MSQGTQRLAFGGMPTGPDVKRIREHYPDSELIEGATEITHQEIAEILGESMDSNRFRTVASAWRSAVRREAGKDIDSENKTFKVLDDSGRLGLVERYTRKGARQERKAWDVLGRIDRNKLTADEDRRAEENRTLLSQSMNAKRRTANQIRSKQAVPSLTEGV